MKKYIYLFLVFSGFLFASDIPHMVNYQGKLFEDSGPVTGDKSIGYRLYDAGSGGNLCWEQSAHTVSVDNGLFTDTLGLCIDTTFAKYSALWLEVVVEGTALSRERIHAAPWALTVADKAITAAKLDDGISAGQIFQWNGTAWQLADGSSLGNVADGTVANQTLRWDGSQWLPSDALTNDDTDIAATGDFTVAGNDIYGSGTGDVGFYIHSRGNIRMDIDDNDNGGSTFAVRDGEDNLVFEVDENGDVDADGYGSFDGDLTVSGDSRNIISGDALNIRGNSGVDVYIDYDNTGGASEFYVKTRDALPSDVLLFRVDEDGDATIYRKLSIVPQSSAPGAEAGDLYVKQAASAADTLKFYTGSNWVNVAPVAAGGAASLQDAYEGGNTIEVDAGHLTVEISNATGINVTPLTTISDVGAYEAAYFGHTASGNAIKTGGDGKCGNIWVASDNVIISAGQLNATSTVAGTPAVYATNSAGGNAIQAAGKMWFSSGNLYTENNWTLYSKSSGLIEQNVFTPINGDDNTILRIGPGNNLYFQDNGAGNIAQFADGENALFLWGNIWLRDNRIVYDGITDDNQTYIGFVEPTNNDNVINFPDGSGTVSLLGQTIESGEITDGTITTVDIEASASDAVLVSDGTVQWSVATDDKYLKYTAAGGFEWADAGGAGSADYDWNNRYGGDPENSDSVYHTGLVTIGAVADPLRSNTKLHVKNGNIELADNWGVIFYDASSKIHAVSPDLFISSAHDLYISSDGDDKIDMCSGLLVMNNSVDRVGINATSIDYDLDVDGDIGIGDEISPSDDRLIHNGDDDTYIRFDSDALFIYAGGECLVDITEAGQDYVKIGDGGDVDVNLNDYLFVRGSDGNVGIGTAVPGQLLDVRDDVYIGDYSTSDGESEFLRINAENEEWYVGVRNLTAPNSRFFIGLDQTDNKFAIDPGGNIGIGTVSPAEKLDVSGAIKLGTTAGTNTGTIRWDGSNFQGYDGTDWVNLDEATGATQLDDLTDVTITGAANGDILYYNGTGWVNLVKGSDGQALTSTSTSIEWGSAGDNLGNHIATQDLRPDATGTHDLGTATYKWDNLYVGTVHANQIDPIVQINGKQYVTWMAEAVGMWIETIGVGRLSGSAYKIDLAAQPEGSDLWLFYNVVAESTIVPFVTPQDDAYLVARIEGSVLMVKALSGDGEARFGFRLSGKRRDWTAKSTEKVNIPKQRIDDPVNMDLYDKNGNLK